MGKYILKRLLLIIPIILGVAFIIYAIMDLTPGDPALQILGPAANEEEINALREELGLNGNFFVRFVKYIWDVLHGDFGTSYRLNTPVIDEITQRIPTTCRLAVGAALIMILVGVPVGVISAVKQYSIFDTIGQVGSMVMSAIPRFWLGLMLMIWISLKLDLLPATGSDTWQSFILPCITLAISPTAAVIRMTRTSVLDIINQDYIRTARAKGLKEKRVVAIHILRNASLPTITVIGSNFAAMMGGAVIIENVFAMGGVGSLLVMSVKMRDVPLVMCCTMFVALVVCVTNLLIDILYMLIDPRLRIKS
ncbi:MAG: ABC transporter permease [Oscillospiraceae bacterium]